MRITMPLYFRKRKKKKAERASKKKIIELDSLCFSYIIIATIIVDGTTELNTYKKNKSIILGKFTY